MTRKEAREQAFFIIFEYSFCGGTAEELLELAAQCRELEPDEYTVEVVKGVLEQLSILDEKIYTYLKGWKINRLSRIAISVLRLAIYEILFCGSVPVGVSINEAVELGKTYGGENDSGYINGVLGAFVRAEAAEGEPCEQQ